jgi:hypothetical protein
MNKIKPLFLSLLLITPIHADQAADEALLFAARTGNIDKAKTALDAGANVNCTDLVQGIPYYTPLMLATLHNRSPMVSFLISRGADATKESTGNGDTALAIAFRFNHHSIILKLLIDGNARAEQISIIEWRATCHVDELLEKKPHPDSIDDQITKNIFSLAVLNTKAGREKFQGHIMQAALALQGEFELLAHTQEFQKNPQDFQARYKEFVAQHQKQLRNPRSLRELICAQVKDTLDEKECSIKTTPATQEIPQGVPATHGWFDGLLDRCSVQ